MFQSYKRHFSFNGSENSSFLSSQKSVKRQETINSKGTIGSNRTSTFKIKAQRSKREGEASSKRGSMVKDPTKFKYHLKAIALMVDADKPSLLTPPGMQVSKPGGGIISMTRKRNSMTPQKIPDKIDLLSNRSGHSHNTSRGNNTSESKGEDDSSKSAGTANFQSGSFSVNLA